MKRETERRIEQLARDIAELRTNQNTKSDLDIFVNGRFSCVAPGLVTIGQKVDAILDYLGIEVYATQRTIVAKKRAPKKA